MSGTGGCPYAKGASGNVASEDVVYMLHGLGIETGIDLDRLAETGRWLAALLGRETGSKVGKALAADMTRQAASGDARARRTLRTTGDAAADAGGAGTGLRATRRCRNHPRRCCSRRATRCATLRRRRGRAHRYRALFDAVPDPVSIIAWDGTVLDLNKAGMAAYRRPREEIVGQPIESSTPTCRATTWRRCGTRSTAAIPTWSKSPTCAATARASRSKCIRPASSYDGRMRIVAVARDLSSRHDAELRYRELMEAIDKGIVVQQCRQAASSTPIAAAMRILELDDGESLDEALRAGALAGRRRARPASCHDRS